MQLSVMQRKKILQILLIFFLYILKKKKTQENKTCIMEMTSYARQNQT